MSKYYVYEYWRLDNNTCFYVGKGSRKRCYNIKQRNKHFKDILNKTECAMVIVADNLTEEEAHQIECYLIHSYVFEEGYGINCKGHKTISGTPYLTNSTWGGEGSSGVVVTDETKKKISKAGKGRKFSEETKQKMSKANKGRKFSEETRQKLSKAKLNKPLSETHRENIKKVVQGKDNPNSKKVICITTGKIFDYIREGARFYGIKDIGGISACCKGRQKSCGKLKDGTPLVWMYYTDYIKECA